MKKILKSTFFIIPLFSNFYCSSQWTQLVSGYSSPTVALKSVHFTTNETGYVAGQNYTAGIILKTVDSGDNWNTVLSTSGTSNFGFESIFFTDINQGFAAGYTTGGAGGVFRTIDGGLNWVELITNSPNYLFDVYFTDANTGFACGNLGTIIKTEDGGDSWTTLTTSIVNNLSDIYFTSNLVGYAVGDGGTIIRTLDAGNNWLPLNSQTSSWLYSIYFSTPNKGIAVGVNGTMTSTNDAGNTWTFQSMGTDRNMFSIQSLNQDTSYVVGGYFGEFIRKTTNSGTSWTTQNSGSGGKPLYDVFFPNDTLGFAVGQEGKIIRLGVSSAGIYEVSTKSIQESFVQPNPFTDYSFIWFENTNTDIFQLILYDAIGNEVRIINDISTNSVKIERQNLNNGFYYYKLKSNDKAVSIGKIIVE